MDTKPLSDFDRLLGKPDETHTFDCIVHVPFAQLVPARPRARRPSPRHDWVAIAASVDAGDEVRVFPTFIGWFLHQVAAFVGVATVVALAIVERTPTLFR
jgi:hypothetical protein